MQCTRCHRPLAADDAAEGLCCADAIGLWHCALCGQTSEGFAFAYGLCPHCSGRLRRQDTPRAGAAESAAVEGVRLAFEIELGGRAFYQRAAADSTDPVMRALFGGFAVLEGEHMETLSRRYHIDAPAPSAALRVEAAALFAEVENRPQDPVNLFRIAIGLEQRAQRFFDERAALADAGSATQRLYRELAVEERAHAELLIDELARWRAGRPGRLASDRHAAPPRPAGALPAPMNAAATLLEGQDAQRTALVCTTGESLDYGSLRERVARGAALWRERGVGPGHRVAIKLSDGPDWVVAFLGTIWCGAIAVGVNPRVPVADWQYILDEAGFSVILAESLEDTPSPWRERVMLQGDWRNALQHCAARRRTADGRRCAGLLVPFVGHLGQAQGGGACPPLRAANRTGLARRPGHRCRRPLVRQFQAVLLVPADQQPVRRLEAGRHRDPRPAVADGRQRGRHGGGAAPDRAAERAVAVPQSAARGPRPRHRAGRRAPLRVGRRGAGGQPARRVAAADRAGHRQRLRRLGDAGPGDARPRRRGGLRTVARGRDPTAVRAERPACRRGC